MAEKTKPSLVVNLIHYGADVVAKGAPLLGIPVVGTLAEFVKDVPVTDLQDWSERTRRRFWKADGTGPEGATAPLPVPQLATPHGAETAARNPAELVRSPAVDQAVDVLMSEPFQIAMIDAIGKLPAELGRFLAMTHPAKSTDPVAKQVGVWPTFVLEWIARRHFKSKLGHSAAAAESPNVRMLVESGLAQDAIETLTSGVKSAREAGAATTQGILLGYQSETTRLWTTDEKWEWPGVDDLSRGYFVGHRSQNIFGLPLDQLTWDPETAKASRMSILGTLGRMDRPTLSYLSAAWLRTCEASVLPAVARIAQNLRVDRGLSRLRIPVWEAVGVMAQRGATAQDQAEFEATLEAMLRSWEQLSGLTRGGFDLDADFGRISQAVAMDDGEAAFGRAVSELRVMSQLVAKLEPGVTGFVPAVDAAIERLARLRGWPA